MNRRILLFITDLEIGGTPSVVRELAIRLHRPPEVTMRVACLSPWGPVADQLKQAGIEVTAFGLTRPWQLPSAVRRLRELIGEQSIDTLFSFLIHANTVAAMAMRKLDGVRFVQSIQTTQPYPRWHWWLQGRIYGRARKIAVPSFAIARVAQHRSGIPAERFDIIPNAVTVDDFPRVKVFDGPVTRIGFLGRLDPVKRLPVAIAAAWSIRQTPAKLLIFGHGEARATLQSHQERTFNDPSLDWIEWKGAVEDPRQALAQMDVLVLPSLGEGFGLVLIEAMASGIPVIASAAGGILDVIEHERTGLLVQPRGQDDRAFAAAILRLWRDPELRRRLIDNALAEVRQRFTWSTVLPQYRRLLRLEG
ncbi:MAG: glycosyltransferase family 4 protein [Phycisphaerales bacterium]|jgi:glycosyltransferase involved in cell wall biosynthesis|nr:glycosyltransferase family 4 protein [Phycisphaerales bacterium]